MPKVQGKSCSTKSVQQQGDIPGRIRYIELGLYNLCIFIRGVNVKKLMIACILLIILLLMYLLSLILLIGFELNASIQQAHTKKVSVSYVKRSKRNLLRHDALKRIYKGWGTRVK